MTVRQKIAVSSAGLLAVLFALLLWVVPLITPCFDVSTEQSKSWSDVLKAAQSIRGERYAYGDLGPHQARIFVESNRVLLASVRAGLQKELRVPVKASREWLRVHGDDMRTLKVRRH